MTKFKCPYCQTELEAKEYIALDSWQSFDTEVICPKCKGEFSVDIDLSQIKISTFVLG